MNANLHPVLEARLQPLLEAEALLHRRRVQNWLHFFAALFLPVLAWVLWRSSWPLWQSALYFLGGYLFIWACAIAIANRRQPDALSLARRVEARHPELKGTLLAALEIAPSGRQPLRYLQGRVMSDAVSHAGRQDWRGSLFRKPLRWSLFYGTLSFSLLLISVVATAWLWQRGHLRQSVVAAESSAPTTPGAAPILVQVMPGNVEVERGGRLTVEAKFPGKIPEAASIALLNPDGSEQSSVAMNRTVDASLYGGVLMEIKQDADYRVTYAGGQSEKFRITTFEYPALLRVDAVITPPAWMELPPTEVKNSMNFSVPEGSRVDFKIKVNKALTAAELYGEDKSIVPLAAGPADATLLLGNLQPVKTQKYRVHLVDEKDRANKQPPWITVRVLPNLAPKIEVVFPKRDLAVSPIQELAVEGKVWDDTGVQRAGVTFTLSGQNHEVLLDEKGWKDNKPRPFKSQFALEPLKARPRQLVSYYFWAEDQGGNGKSRRSMSDMFFANVRNFEDIFREQDSPPGEGGKQSQTDEAVKLQKQVVNATWRLLRDTSTGKPLQAVSKDVEVVRQSQTIAREKTAATAEKVQDTEIKQALENAMRSMEKAAGQLQLATKGDDTKLLDESLKFESEALEYLDQAQARETRVSRSKSSQGSGSAAQQQQLMQLELKQEDRRYEEEKQAGEEASPEQQESLLVLNRLKELAARQEALAQKMKELEQQSANAKSEQEKDEIERQLKRLQEEQEQLLKDMDNLNERMEQPDNMAPMNEAREKLQAARQQAQEAADQLKDQKASQAANNATRAQRQLEEIRDDFREKTAKQFAAEMRQIKQEAGQLEQTQQQLSADLEKTAGENAKSRPRNNGEELQQQMKNGQLSRRMEEQREALEKTLESVRKLSEAAEVAEPLLSSTLYDAVRQTQSTGVEKALENARDLTSMRDLPRAQEQEQRAAKGISELKENIDKAAERVLGSEAEALRMARAELDRLLKDVRPGETGEKEGEQGEAGKSPGSQQQKSDESKQPGEDQAGQLAQQGEKKGGVTPSQKPGETGAPGKERGLKEGQAAGQDGLSGAQQNGQESQAGQMADNGQNSPGQQLGKEGQKGSPGQQPGAEKPEQGEGQSQGEGKGQMPGQGEGQNPGQTASSDSKGAGQQGSKSGQQAQAGQPGQAGTPGQQEGAASTPGSSPSSQASASGDKPGEGQDGQGSSSGSPSSQRPQGKGGLAQGGSRNSSAGGGGNSGGADNNQGGISGGQWFFDDASPQREAASPLTGGDYERWADGLRRVEELLDAPDLRNQAARVRDEARDMRLAYRRNNQPPQADTIATRITNPLVELRDRVSEELAKKEARNPIAPLDRDPVAPRYRELVRRYYEELGSGTAGGQ